MPQGPLGGRRPFVKTSIKYDIAVSFPERIFHDPPKAIDVLDIRVNSPQMDLVDHIEKQIGEVLLACNRLQYPSRYEVVDADLEDANTSDLVQQGRIQITWTYIIRGHGLGKYANTSATSDAVWKMHEVMERGNNEPISRSRARHEFETGPARIENISLTTQ